MKRTIVLLLAAISAFNSLYAQASKSPFTKLGYKKQVAYSSSKGEFDEFHDQNSIIEIGSVYFNTETNKIVGFINDDAKQNNVNPVTTAMSVDPLCEKYYWISPYAYCFNNPVRYIDPDGRAPGDFFVSKDAAATDWGNYYNGRSIIKGKELGSTIYPITKNGSYGYTYTVAAEGGAHKTKVSPAPAGKKAEADIHSHGKYEKEADNDNFSSTDKWDNYNNKIDGYLTTPSGTLQKYDVVTAETTVINTQLPSDPNDPERKNKVKPTDKTTTNTPVPPPPTKEEDEKKSTN